MRNEGCGGIDKMSCEQLLPMAHDQQGCADPFLDGRLLPSELPSERIYPKTTARCACDAYSDRPCVQHQDQSVPSMRTNSPRTSYGFRPRRGCHDPPLRGAQRVINEGYTYVVDLDLERFFDTVSHSKFHRNPQPGTK